MVPIKPNTIQNAKGCCWKGKPIFILYMPVIMVSATWWKRRKLISLLFHWYGLSVMNQKFLTILQLIRHNPLPYPSFLEVVENIPPCHQYNLWYRPIKICGISGAEVWKWYWSKWSFYGSQKCVRWVSGFIVKRFVVDQFNFTSKVQ